MHSQCRTCSRAWPRNKASTPPEVSPEPVLPPDVSPEPESPPDDVSPELEVVVVDPPVSPPEVSPEFVVFDVSGAVLLVTGATTGVEVADPEVPRTPVEVAVPPELIAAPMFP